MNPVRPFLLLLFAALVLTGCAGTAPALVETPAPRPSPALEAAPVDFTREAARAHPYEASLREALTSWEGTPYQWGGTTRSGADCSGFLQALFKETFQVALPRTTGQQVHVGEPVERHELTTGDLVFFTPEGKSRHVGVYLQDGAFAHASSSRGVMVSYLDEAYWQRAYWTARRVLPSVAAPRPRLVRAEPAPPPAAPLLPAAPGDEALPRKRVGW